MALKLFDYWANLTSKKVQLNPECREDVNGYSPYMINRLASMINLYLPLAAEAGKYDIPKDVHYNLWFNSLPKRYIKFTYLKKNKDDDSEDIENKIAEYYESGTRDTKVIMNMLSKEQKKEICKKFGGRV